MDKHKVNMTTGAPPWHSKFGNVFIRLFNVRQNVTRVFEVAN